MRFLIAVALTALLGLAAGFTLAGFNGAISEGTAPAEAFEEGVLDRWDARNGDPRGFPLAEGAANGLAAGALLGTVHWLLRFAGASRSGRRVGLFRILGGTIGFAVAAAVGAALGGLLGTVFSGLSPAWTGYAIDLGPTEELAPAAWAFGSTHGALAGAALYALSAFGSFRPAPPKMAPSPA